MKTIYNEAAGEASNWPKTEAGQVGARGKRWPGAERSILAGFTCTHVRGGEW